VETAALLSKKALMRPIGSHNENERAAKMEKLLEDGINAIGLGPQGMGGMKEQTAAACKDFGCIHVVIPAGNAVVAAVAVEEIVRAEWRDLGMPETLWNCRVKEFGPLIVSIDAQGRNYFEEKKVEYNKRKDEQIEKICKEVKFIK
jgi:L(+)-tartrate dehydratase beta subunit